MVGFKAPQRATPIESEPAAQAGISPASDRRTGTSPSRPPRRPPGRPAAGPAMPSPTASALSALRHARELAPTGAAPWPACWAGPPPRSSKVPSLQDPRGADLAVRRLVTGLDARETAAGPRLDEDVLVARRGVVDLDARHHAIHPVADRAVGVVVERVHAGVLERAVGLLPVPALPDRRRALLDRDRATTDTPR